MAKFCRYCGSPVRESSKFCKKCGRKLTVNKAAGVKPAGIPANAAPLTKGSAAGKIGNELGKAIRLPVSQRLSGGLSPAAASGTGEQLLGTFSGGASTAAESITTSGPLGALFGSICTLIGGIFGIFRKKNRKALVIALLVTALWLAVLFIPELREHDEVSTALEYVTFIKGITNRSAAGMVGGFLGMSTIAAAITTVFGGGLGRVFKGLRGLFSNGAFKGNNFGNMLIGAGFTLCLYQFFVGTPSIEGTMAAIAGFIVALRSLGGRSGIVYRIAAGFTSKAQNGKRSLLGDKAGAMVSGAALGFAAAAGLSAVDNELLPLYCGIGCIAVGITILIFGSPKKAGSAAAAFLLLNGPLLSAAVPFRSKAEGNIIYEVSDDGRSGKVYQAVNSDIYMDFSISGGYYSTKGYDVHGKPIMAVYAEPGDTITVSYTSYMLKPEELGGWYYSEGYTFNYYFTQSMSYFAEDTGHTYLINERETASGGSRSGTAVFDIPEEEEVRDRESYFTYFYADIEESLGIRYKEDENNVTATSIGLDMQIYVDYEKEQGEGSFTMQLDKEKTNSAYSSRNYETEIPSSYNIDLDFYQIFANAGNIMVEYDKNGLNINLPGTSMSTGEGYEAYTFSADSLYLSGDNFEKRDRDPIYGRECECYYTTISLMGSLRDHFFRPEPDSIGTTYECYKTIDRVDFSLCICKYDDDSEWTAFLVSSSWDGSFSDSSDYVDDSLDSSFEMEQDGMAFAGPSNAQATYLFTVNNFDKYIEDYSGKGSKDTGDDEDDHKTKSTHTSHASYEEGETETTIPEKIVTGAAAAAAAASGAAAAAGAAANSGGPSDRGGDGEKKKKQYKMYIYKGFGGAVRRGAAPVTVYARITETDEHGFESDRPDLSERITVSGKILEVSSAGMYENYTSANISVPKETEAASGTLTFTYSGEGGVFTNNLVFDIVGDPRFVFFDEGSDEQHVRDLGSQVVISTVGGGGETLTSRFFIENATEEPKEIVFETEGGVTATYENAPNFYTYEVHIVNSSEEIVPDENGFAQPVDIEVRVIVSFADGSELTGSIVLRLYPLGICITEKPNEDGRIEVGSYLTRDPEKLTLDPLIRPTKIGICVMAENSQGGFSDVTDEVKWGKYSLTADDSGSENLVKGYEYRVDFEDDRIYFRPDVSIPELGSKYLVKLNIGCTYGGEEYNADIPIRLMGKRFDTQTRDFEKEKQELINTVYRFIPEDYQETELSRINSLCTDPDEVDQSMMRILRYRILARSQYYWTMEGELAIGNQYNAEAKVLDTIVSRLEFAKFCGDMAFKVVITVYFPNHEFWITPSKDLIVDTIADVLASDNLSEVKFGEKLLEQAANVFENKLGLKDGNDMKFVITQDDISNICICLVCYVLFDFSKNYFYSEPTDFWESLRKTLGDLSLLAVKKIASMLFMKGMNSETVKKWFAGKLGDWLSKLTPGTIRGNAATSYPGIKYTFNGSKQIVGNVDKLGDATKLVNLDPTNSKLFAGNFFRQGELLGMAGKGVSLSLMDFDPDTVARLGWKSVVQTWLDGAIGEGIGWVMDKADYESYGKKASYLLIPLYLVTRSDTSEEILGSVIGIDWTKLFDVAKNGASKAFDYIYDFFFSWLKELTPRPLTSDPAREIINMQNRIGEE